MSVRYVLRPTPASTPTSEDVDAGHGGRRRRRRRRRRARRSRCRDEEARIGSALGSGPANAGGRRLDEDLVRRLAGDLGRVPRVRLGRDDREGRIATIGMASTRPGRGRLGSHRLAATASSRQTRNSGWRASSAHSTAGLNRVAASRGMLVLATMSAPMTIAPITGSPNRAARRRRPANRCPSPGNNRSRSAGR